MATPGHQAWCHLQQERTRCSPLSQSECFQTMLSVNVKIMSSVYSRASHFAPQSPSYHVQQSSFSAVSEH